MFVRPLEDGIVVLALVLRTPAGTILRVALKGGVGSTHNRLSEVIEAVGRVVGYFIG